MFIESKLINIKNYDKYLGWPSTYPLTDYVQTI